LFQRCSIWYKRTSSCVHRIETSTNNETVREFAWIGNVVFWSAHNTIHEGTVGYENCIDIFHRWIDVDISSCWIQSSCCTFCYNHEERIWNSGILICYVCINLNISTFSVDDFWSRTCRRIIDVEEISWNDRVIIVSICVGLCWYGFNPRRICPVQNRRLTRIILVRNKSCDIARNDTPETVRIGLVFTHSVTILRSSTSDASNKRGFVGSDIWNSYWGDS